MEKITNILMCPECHCSLTESLECNNCHHIYTYSYGVYDIVSPKISSDQESLGEITDEMIKDMLSEKYQTNWSETIQDYYGKMNQETLDAMRKQDDYLEHVISNISGVVCDLATDGGGMLQKLLDAKQKDFLIVCTDIDKRELIMTRKINNTNDERVFYVATEGRHMSIKDESFDYITSFAGFGNIPEGDKVVKELYRMLKPGGRIIIKGGYIEENSKSFELAKSVGVERGMIEEYLLGDLESAGFVNVVSNVVSQAIWAENPYDLIPSTGDMQRYCIIQAQRPL